MRWEYLDKISRKRERIRESRYVTQISKYNIN